MAGEQGIFRKPHPRRGAVAEPLFRHEGRAELAPAGDREMAGGLAIDHDGAGVFRRPLAGEGGKQLVLAVAGDAGNPQDFAALQFQ